MKTIHEEMIAVERLRELVYMYVYIPKKVKVQTTVKSGFLIRPFRATIGFLSVSI